MIEGNWQLRSVTVGGMPLSPERSQRVWNHSPDGFAWGYAGSGPAQLALALLLHFGVDEKRAVACHQRFKFDCLAPLPQADFVLAASVVEQWIRDNVADAAACREG